MAQGSRPAWGCGGEAFPSGEVRGETRGGGREVRLGRRGKLSTGGSLGGSSGCGGSGGLDCGEDPRGGLVTGLATVRQFCDAGVEMERHDEPASDAAMQISIFAVHLLGGYGCNHDA